MPSNEERREVAARLRERAAMRYRYNHQDPDLLGCLVTNLTKPHCGEPTIGNVLSRLADLIEPEERTCEKINANSNDILPRCSECNSLIGHYVNYCQMCGAKVVEQ